MINLTYCYSNKFFCATPDLILHAQTCILGLSLGNFGLYDDAIVQYYSLLIL